MTYSVAEVCEIIKVCHTNGVAKFQVADLKIAFGVAVPPTQPQEVVLTAEQATLAAQNERQAFTLTESQIRERNLEMLRLEDPEAFEDLIARGELENARQEPDGVNA